jgi:hypothetical protein
MISPDSIRHTKLIRILRRIKYFFKRNEKLTTNIPDVTPDNIASLRRGFEMFGYVKLEGLFNSKQIATLIREFDAVVLNKTGVSLQSTDICPKALINTLNELPSLPEIIQKSELMPVLFGLFGEDFKIIGSDLSMFRNPSSLHRDSYSEFFCPKIAIYLQSSNSITGGQLVVIPGSHRKDEAFSEDCNAGLSYARSNGYEPSHWTNVLRKKNSFELSITDPVTKIDIKKGDIVIFDERLVHGTAQRSNKLRRLIAICLIEGYSSFSNRKPNVEYKGYLDRVCTHLGAAMATNLPRLQDCGSFSVAEDLKRYESFRHNVLTDVDEALIRQRSNYFEVNFNEALAKIYYEV